jgi:hypothetical protein
MSFGSLLARAVCGSAPKSGEKRQVARIGGGLPKNLDVPNRYTLAVRDSLRDSRSAGCQPPERTFTNAQGQETEA